MIQLAERDITAAAWAISNDGRLRAYPLLYLISMRLSTSGCSCSVRLPLEMAGYVSPCRLKTTTTSPLQRTWIHVAGEFYSAAGLCKQNTHQIETHPRTRARSEERRVGKECRSRW